jgi:uncharacterized protein YlxW (UPF0749 family)
MTVPSEPPARTPSVGVPVTGPVSAAEAGPAEAELSEAGIADEVRDAGDGDVVDSAPLAGPDLAVDPDGAGAPPPREEHAGAWHTLMRALQPRLTRAQALAAILCGLLGFAVVAQVRVTHDTSLSTLRQSDLVGILDQATQQGDELQREAAALEQTRQELQSGSTSRQAALDAATRSAATQGILTGRLPANGPGIVVTLTEASGSIRALTLLNFLEELRNAGAEAVQLNNLRLTASSYVVSSSSGIVVDGTTLHAPYTWTVIGDPDTMATALDIPGGALASVRADGGQGDVIREQLVSVTATRVVPTPVDATPVPPKGG